MEYYNKNFCLRSLDQELHNPRISKVLLILISLRRNLDFSLIPGLIHSTDESIKKVLLFEEHWLEKPSISFRNIYRHNRKTPILLGLILVDFETLVLPKVPIDFFLQGRSAPFSLFWKTRLNFIEFLPCSGIMIKQKCQLVVLALTVLDILTNFSSAVPASLINQILNS